MAVFCQVHIELALTQIEAVKFLHDSLHQTEKEQGRLVLYK